MMIHFHVPTPNRLLHVLKNLSPTPTLNPVVHNSHRPPSYNKSTMASRQEKKGASKEEEHAGKKTTMSLEEIGKYRATAQQNSVESIRAAEERYAKAKESASAALKDTKETVTHGASAAAAYAAAKGVEAKDKAVHGARVATDYTMEKGAAAKDWAGQKAGEAKEAAWGGGQRTEEHIGPKQGQAKESTWPTAEHGDEKEKLGEEPYGTQEKLRGLPIGGGETTYKDYTGGEGYEEDPRTLMRDHAPPAASSGGLLEAVGEAVIGIANTAKEFVLGRDRPQ